MSTTATLARPYAKAAFELARDEGGLREWDEMLTLAASIAADESVRSVLESPEVSSEEVLAVFTDTAGEAFSERFRGFLAVMATNGRLALLPETTALFRRLRDEAEARLHVRVVSAMPLDEDQARRLGEALTKRFERQIELENDVDPDIIGGAIVYAGDQVIDGSLRGRLHKLSTALAH